VSARVREPRPHQKRFERTDSDVRNRQYQAEHEYAKTTDGQPCVCREGRDVPDERFSRTDMDPFSFLPGQSLHFYCRQS